MKSKLVTDSSTQAIQLALDEELLVVCPVCAESFMHPKEMESDTSDVYKNPSWRLPIRGEACGHTFALVLGYHKGQVFLKMEGADS